MSAEEPSSRIEVRKKEAVVSSLDEYDLFIDGSLVESVFISSSYLGKNEDNRAYSLTTSTKEATDKVAAFSLSELTRYGLVDFRLIYSPDWLDPISQVWMNGLSKEGINQVEAYSIQITFNRLSHWVRKYSFAEYFEELTRLIKESGIPNIMSPDDDEWKWIGRMMPMEVYSIAVGPCSPELPIAREITRCFNILRDIHEMAVREVESRIHSSSVVVSFDFPEEVRVPCEQYLLYFVQFLKDLGVEATAELQHEAGRVLFAVTPTNKDEALDSIRLALTNYLKLAASPVNPASVLNSEIEVQRLSANIQHLQGQLTLAHAVLQAKDATIELQQATISQQRRFIDGEVMLESMKDVTPKPKENDAEEVLGGLAEITKYEGKGFNLNLPEAFRRMKQLFKEKKGGKR